MAGALLCAFAPSATFLIGARFILGLAVGCASFVAPMYIAELAPKRSAAAWCRSTSSRSSAAS